MGRRKSSSTSSSVSVGASIGEDGIAWFNCTECDFRTTTKMNLKLHINRMHTEDHKVQWLYCSEPECDYKTPDKSNFRKHIFQKHTKAPLEWLFCPQPECDYKTKVRGFLNMHHIRKHADQQQVQWHWCTQMGCTYKTAEKVNLKKHQKCHMFEETKKVRRPRKKSQPKKHTGPQIIATPEGLEETINCVAANISSGSSVAAPTMQDIVQNNIIHNVMQSNLMNAMDPYDEEWYRCLRAECEYKTKDCTELKHHIINYHVEGK